MGWYLYKDSLAIIHRTALNKTIQLFISVYITAQGLMGKYSGAHKKPLKVLFISVCCASA
jgi:hypothetical protein